MHDVVLLRFQSGKALHTCTTFAYWADLSCDMQMTAVAIKIHCVMFGVTCCDELFLVICSQENPFKYRICKVFTSDEAGFMDFDDFVHLVSVMSDKVQFLR